MARILVIEDNSANLELMSYLLRSSGHQLFAASDGFEGIAVAQRERPDLIICDVQLPDIDGFEVTRRLAADRILGSIPRVAVTAYAMVGDRERVLAGGFDAYVAKPIDPETFVAGIEAVLQAPLTSRMAARPPEPVPRAGKATIVVVDDRPVNLEVVRSTFEPLGYRVLGAESVQEALASARRVGPDLIISDVHMPAESGYDLLKAVNADEGLRSIPVIFLASSPRHPARRAEALTLGAARYIIRPIEPEALIAEVEDCLREHAKA
jgi:two-component system cell cycle response regulator